MIDDFPLLLTARQAAELVGVDESTWYRWVRTGQVPEWVCHPVTYGQPKRRRYSKEQVQLWAKTTQKNGSGDSSPRCGALISPTAVARS